MKTRKLVMAVSLMTSMSFAALSNAQILGGGVGGAAGGAFGGHIGNMNNIDGGLRGGARATGALDARGAAGLVDNTGNGLKTRAERIAEKSRAAAARTEDVAAGSARSAVAGTTGKPDFPARGGIETTQRGAAEVGHSTGSAAGAVSAGTNSALAAGSRGNALDIAQGATARNATGAAPDAGLGGRGHQAVANTAAGMAGNHGMDDPLSQAVNPGDAMNIGAKGGIANTTSIGASSEGAHAHSSASLDMGGSASR